MDFPEVTRKRERLHCFREWLRGPLYGEQSQFCVLKIRFTWFGGRCMEGTELVIGGEASARISFFLDRLMTGWV